MKPRIIVLALINILLCCFSVHASDPPVVAIAANMTHAMSEIVDSYQSETGNSIRVSYGSSGNFTRQLVQGAPYELFISAHKMYADRLVESTNIIASSFPFVTGRIVLFIPNESKLSESENLEAAITALQFGQYRRVVIANPEHAPYGMAAQQSLHSAGVWTILRKRLLLAENAAQAAQFAISGGIDMGIIPYSLAVVPEISEQGSFFVIPETWHEPIHQYLILMNGAGATTRSFYNFLRTNDTMKTLENYGYFTPRDFVN